MGDNRRQWKMMQDNDSSSSKSSIGGSCKPDVTSYNTLMKAWSKYCSTDDINRRNDAPAEVEKLLEEMIDLHKAGKLPGGPNEVTCTTFIKCLQNFDKSDDNGTKTLLYNDRMRELKTLRGYIVKNGNYNAAVLEQQQRQQQAQKQH